MIQEKTSPKREEQRQVGFQREVEEQGEPEVLQQEEEVGGCLLYTSPSPRD